MTVIYVCRGVFQNGGLWERTLPENGGLSERPQTGDFGPKLQQNIVFKERGSFGAARPKNGDGPQTQLRLAHDAFCLWKGPPRPSWQLTFAPVLRW